MRGTARLVFGYNPDSGLALFYGHNIALTIPIQNLLQHTISTPHA